MRKRIAIVLLVLFAVVIGVIILPEVFSNEPTYHGKRVSTWFRQYCRSGFGSEPDMIDLKDAKDAFRAMGTNAVPLLIERYLNAEPDWPMRAKVQTFLHKHLHFPEYFTAEDLAANAAIMLLEIRPPAEMVIPLATNRLASSDPGVRDYAIGLLGCIGSGAELAVPWLRQYLQPTNEHANTAIYSLCLLRKAATLATPELEHYLASSSSNQTSPLFLYSALQRIGPPASNAIPILEAQFNLTTNETDRFYFAATLCAIDPTKTNALFEIMRDPSHLKSWEFADMRAEMKAAAPALADILRSNESKYWFQAANALWKMGETNLVVETLTERMKSPDAKTRVMAAAAMVDVEPGNALAISNLVASLQDPSVASKAAAHLVAIRPVPQAAVLALRAIAADPKNQSRKNALKALDVLSWQQKDEAKKR